MRILMISMLLVMLSSCSSEAEVKDADGPKVEISDLEQLLGADWTGTLTYLNYQEPFRYFTIPATLEVTSVQNGVELFFQYPEEPDQNSSVIVKISEDGRSLGSENVVGRVKQDGGVIINTKFDCMDNGSEAACSISYLISSNEFKFTKTVEIDGEEPFMRNEFSFSR